MQKRIAVLVNLHTYIYFECVLSYSSIVKECLEEQ